MSNYETEPPTQDELQLWIDCDKKYDPRTGERTKRKSDTYKLLNNHYKNSSGTSSSDLLNNLDLSTPDDKEVIEEKEISKYRHNGEPITYTDYTMTTLCSIRYRKMDIISYTDLTSEKESFAFPWQWDPYTGDRLELDPYGPLYFDVDQLIRYFWENRLEHLFVQPSDEQGGFYAGYHAEGVGAGENFSIPGRGDFPEWYAFRLPIIDAYLTKDHSRQIPTMGPKLTNEEIKEIYEKSVGLGNRYMHIHRLKRPNLIEMKRLYDLAINPRPPVPADLPQDDDSVQEYRTRINREAVDGLVLMK